MEEIYSCLSITSSQEDISQCKNFQTAIFQITKVDLTLNFYFTSVLFQLRCILLSLAAGFKFQSLFTR